MHLFLKGTHVLKQFGVQGGVDPLQRLREGFHIQLILEVNKCNHCKCSHQCSIMCYSRDACV